MKFLAFTFATVLCLSMVVPPPTIAHAQRGSHDRCRESAKTCTGFEPQSAAAIATCPDSPSGRAESSVDCARPESIAVGEEIQAEKRLLANKSFG